MCVPKIHRPTANAEDDGKRRSPRGLRFSIGAASASQMGEHGGGRQALGWSTAATRSSCDGECLALVLTLNLCARRLCSHVPHKAVSVLARFPRAGALPAGLALSLPPEARSRRRVPLHRRLPALLDLHRWCPSRRPARRPLRRPPQLGACLGAGCNAAPTARDLAPPATRSAARLLLPTASGRATPADAARLSPAPRTSCTHITIPGHRASSTRGQAPTARTATSTRGPALPPAPPSPPGPDSALIRSNLGLFRPLLGSLCLCPLTAW